MKQLFLPIAAIFAAIICTGYSHAKVVTYDAGPFDHLSVMGDVNISYACHPDSSGMVTYTSDTDFSDALEISNNKGKLTIKVIPGHDLGELPEIRVYSDYLSQIRNEGKGSLSAELSTQTPTFSARLIGNGKIVVEGIRSPEVKASISTGNGSIVLRGNCRQANFDLAGTGVIQADGLEAESVRCSALGTGSIGCWATRTLDVRGIGTTKIYYRGEPKVKKVGGANISPIYEEEGDSIHDSAPDDEPADY